MMSGKMGQMLLAGIVAGLLVGCGAGNSHGTDATSITVIATEFGFNPSGVNVAAAHDVSITLENPGAVEHEWVVLNAGTNIDSETDFDESQVLFRLSPVAAGETASNSFNLAAGSYQIICSIDRHFAAGMKGTLTVGAA